MEAFVGCPDKAKEILRIFGIETPLEEISAMGIGSASGASGGVGVPLSRSGSGRSPGKRDVKKARKKKKNEYIDLSLIDEVYELLMERGVLK